MLCKSYRDYKINEKHSTFYFWVFFFCFFGGAGKILDPASGGADDYFKGVFGTKLTFTLEVSSAGEDSFIVPPTKIEGVAREVFEGIKVIAKYVAELKW